MKIRNLVRFAFAALAIGSIFGISLPVKAGHLVWVRAQPVDHFSAVGLLPPGSYSHMQNETPATIAVSKAGQGVGEKKQTTSKLAQRKTSQATN